MESLKSLDSALYLLIANPSEKTFADIEKIIIMYKTDDETLIQLIKYASNQVFEYSPQNYISTLYKGIIKTSLKRLKDLSKFIMSLIQSNALPDFLLIFDVIDYLQEDPQKKELLDELIISLITNPVALENINNYLLLQEPAKVSRTLNKLLNILITNNNPDVALFVRSIIYSSKVNALNYDTFMAACKYISICYKLNNSDIISEIAFEYINDLHLLKDLQEELNDEAKKGIKNKIGIPAIYHYLYTAYKGSDAKNKSLLSEPFSVLDGYSKETLEEFSLGVPIDYINKDYQGYDLVSSFIELGHFDLALKVFNKKEYKPINKQGRRNFFNTGHLTAKRFDGKLMRIISACFEVSNYQVLLKILMDHRVDSLSADTLITIIKNITLDDNEPLGQEIIEFILEKIRSEKLVIYQEKGNWLTPKSADYKLLVETACDFIIYLLNNIGKIEDDELTRKYFFRTEKSVIL